MSDKILKEKLESNSKQNSLAHAILVHWKWDDERIYRTFLGLRHGGTAETLYDLEVKYPEDSKEKETVLVNADQLAQLSHEEQVDKVASLLSEGHWKWEPSQSTNFREIAQEFLK